MSEQSGTAKDGKAQAKADKAYKKASRPWFKKKRFVLLGIILIAAVASSLGGGGGGSDSDSSTESSETAAQEPALVVTAKQLIDELEANALNAKTTYDDKRVTVTGKLSNIDASGDYFSLKGGDFSFTSVQIYIDDSLISTVSGFKTGQSVTVTGKVTGVGEILGYSIRAESIP